MDDVRVVVVTPYDPADVRQWSGTPHFMIAELKRQFSDVRVISGWRSTRVIKGLRRLVRRFGVEPQREMLTSWIVGRLVSPAIRRLRPDLVVGIGACHMIADLHTDAPLMNFTDATFAVMVDYNQDFRGLSRHTLRQGDAQERASMRRAALNVVTSDWAASSAIRDYGVAPANVVRVPLGANFETWPAPPAPHVSDGVLRLLFIGTNWRQKGGDVAVEVLRKLEASGLEVELHVVGCDPPAELADAGLKRHGFLHKSDPAERAELEALYRTSSFFLLPTLAEAYGLVFAEASAYGLPVVARRTGGTASPVETGVNGALMDEDAGADAYADWILACWSDPERYAALRQSSRRKFEAELNWAAWGRRVAGLARGVMARDEGAEPQHAAGPATANGT
jgi:glycosyltransferase involved in cell wall biosynthesis